jgi:hypothetical protein
MMFLRIPLRKYKALPFPPKRLLGKMLNLPNCDTGAGATVQSLKPAAAQGPTGPGKGGPLGCRVATTDIGPQAMCTQNGPEVTFGAHGNSGESGKDARFDFMQRFISALLIFTFTSIVGEGELSRITELKFRKELEGIKCDLLRNQGARCVSLDEFCKLGGVSSHLLLESQESFRENSVKLGMFAVLYSLIVREKRDEESLNYLWMAVMKKTRPAHFLVQNDFQCLESLKEGKLLEACEDTTFYLRRLYLLDTSKNHYDTAESPLGKNLVELLEPSIIYFVCVCLPIIYGTYGSLLIDPNHNMYNPIAMWWIDQLHVLRQQDRSKFYLPTVEDLIYVQNDINRRVKDMEEH